jgi:WD40 repeat protein
MFSSRCLALMVMACLVGAGPVLAEGETSTNLVIENSPELAKARDDYQKLMTTARDRLLKAFADEEDQLTSSSKFKPEEKLKRLEQLEKERQAFEENGAIPKSVGLKKAVDTYKKQSQQARDNCSKVFDTQANKILKQDRDAAADILAAKKELLDPTPQAPEAPPPTPTPPGYKELVFTGHIGKVSAVRIVPGTLLLITGGNSLYKTSNGPGKGNTNHPGDDNTIRLWNLTTGAQLVLIKDGLGHANKLSWQVQVLNLTVDRTAFAVATGRPPADYCNPTISVWATETGQQIAHFPLTGRSGVWAPWFSVEGLQLHAFRGDSTWHHFDLKERKELSAKKLSEQAGEEDMQCVCMSSDRQRVFGGMKDGSVRVWSLPEGKDLLKLEGHSGPVHGLAITADDQRLVSAAADGTARVWDLQTGKEISRCAHGGRVLAVAWTPDGSSVVTAGDDRSAALWDAQTGKEIKRFQGHTDEVLSLDISSDGKWLVTGSADKTARTWSLP